MNGTTQRQRPSTSSARTVRISVSSLWAQRFDFHLRQRPRLAFGQIAQLQRTDRHAHKPQHGDVEGFEQAPDLPVAAFVEHDFKPAVLVAAPDFIDAACGEPFAIDIGAGAQTLQRFIGDERVRAMVVGPGAGVTPETPR